MLRNLHPILPPTSQEGSGRRPLSDMTRMTARLSWPISTFFGGPGRRTRTAAREWRVAALELYAGPSHASGQASVRHCAERYEAKASSLRQAREAWIQVLHPACGRAGFDEEALQGARYRHTARAQKVQVALRS